ncbi:MAG: hypothetical protein OXB95_08175 [Rhodobacteraceae bacterium]|nr:hypothetical protein [Paracoccaceae bacterium]
MELEGGIVAPEFVEDVASPHELLKSMAMLREEVRTAILQKEERDEDATRSRFVVPLLGMLGWSANVVHRYWFCSDDSESPRQRHVVTECGSRLLLLSRVFASSIDCESLKSKAEQYSDVLNLQWCVLTNGDLYRLYRMKAPGTFDDRLFMEARMSSRVSDRRICENMALFGRPMQTSGQVEEVWQQLWNERRLSASMEEILAARPRWLTRRLRRETSQTISYAEIGRWLATARMAAGHCNRYFPNFRSEAELGERSIVRVSASDLPSTIDLFNAELIHMGMELTIRGKPDSGATIVDGQNVCFQDSEMSFHSWGLAATGWKGINIYPYAICPDGRSLDQLRRLLGHSS